MTEDRQEHPLTRAGQATMTASGPRDHSRLGMIWAEITSECQLTCRMCYAGSGPRKGHGTMTPGSWENVITHAAALGARHITFIGGEPTLNRALPRLIRHALAAALHAEVYTNLVHVTPRPVGTVHHAWHLPGHELVHRRPRPARRHHRPRHLAADPRQHRPRRGARHLSCARLAFPADTTVPWWQNRRLRFQLS
jgi:hypothetical protein